MRFQLMSLLSSNSKSLIPDDDLSFYFLHWVIFARAS
jgi:hypothetical protein